jgi:hypothetical protein
MELLEHVDIAGDDRLQAILDDPANFNLRAIRAETILDWIPDLGTYTAPSRCRMQHGLHRTPGLAASGVPAVLRHRFWEPEDAAAILVVKYIGLLIYDSADDDYTFELSSGADPIGALRPWRHDNCRHLLVASSPATILGGHVPFQVRATGKGPCYLESIVFLPRLPEASSFAPTIARLQAYNPQAANGSGSVAIHFVTQEAATALVEAVPEGRPADHEVVQGRTGTFERLHAVTLNGLQPNSRYQINVTATEQGGAQASAWLTLDGETKAPVAPAPFAVPVEIMRSRRGARQGLVAGMPMTFGAPLAEGRIADAPSCALRCQAELLPAQTRIHARWPDGSARWLLVDVPCPSRLDTAVQAPAELLVDAPLASPAAGLSWQVSDEAIRVEGRHLRVTVARQGPFPAQIERWGRPLGPEPKGAPGWQRVLGAEGPCLLGELGNGVALASGAPEGLALEEAGAERAVIRYELPLVDPQGVAHFRTTVRLHVYARLAFVRFAVRTVVTSPALAPAFGGQNLDHLTPELEYLRNAVDGSEGEAASLLRVRSLELRLAWDEAAGGKRTRVVQEHDHGYWVEQAGAVEERIGRRPGLFTYQGTGAMLALCIKDFWQRYPKGVRQDGDTITLEILPALSGAPLPGYDDLSHKLYSWYDPARAHYRLKAGLALTVELLAGFPTDEQEAEDWQAWLETPPLVRPDLDYLNATGALLPLTAKAGSPLPHYETLIDGALAAWARLVDERHEYGFANYGDTYSDSEWFWSNNEYDATLCQYVEFLRGGDPAWYLLGGRSARHLTDVDTCNYSAQPAQIGAQYTHIPGHAGGYLPPYFRCKIAGSSFKPSHSWVEGAVLHYLLTGDEITRQVLRATGAQYTRNLANYDFFNARECGWHLIHLCGLARLERDPSLLNAATIIANTVLEKQEPGGGWEHPLAEAHCHCEPPRCHGEAGFMVGVLLSGLRRYYLLTQDARVAEAIVGGARWLATHTFEKEAGRFRYTSCLNRKNPGPHDRQLAEGLAAAQLIVPDPEVAEALRTLLTRLSQEKEFGLKGKPYGRNVSMEARYISIMMPLLVRLLAEEAYA